MKKNSTPVILVPIDFTELTDVAIDHAIGVAKQLKAMITLCHVINKDTKSMLKKQGLHLDGLFKLLQTKALQIKDKHGIETDYMTREGSIFSTIGQIAEESGAHILVMGTHGKIGVQHLIGSYALKVITSSPSPVIVVQKTRFHKECKNIVLPIDYTSESKQKVKWAISMARELKSTVHIFAINDPDEFAAKKIRHNIAHIKSLLSQNDIKCTDKISIEKGGNFAKQVISYADAIKADLIMIMTNREKMLPSFSLGPWDEQLIFNDSRIPVMCINPRDLHIPILKI